MNVQDVATRVKRTFGDDAGVQVTDDDILRWINDAQLEISLANEDLLEAVGTTDIVVNQADYVMPTDMNQLRSLMHDNLRLKHLSFNEFNEYLDGFKDPSNYGPGVPQVFMIYGSTVTLFPAPNQSITGGLRIYYSKHPATVATLADELGVPTRYHNSVVDYCLKMAYEMDENADMSAMKDGQFSAAVQKLKGQEKTTSEYYPRITTLPEDEMFVDGWL